MQSYPPPPPNRDPFCSVWLSSLAMSLNHTIIKLSSGFLKDLIMWQQFIHTWNGAECFLSTSWMDSDSLTLHTDASGTLGYGGILGNKWFQGQWETHQQRNAAGISIAWQELSALVVACHIWADEFANKRIVFYCDNASVVSIVNSKQSRIPRVMDLVRHLTLLTLRHNFYPRERHIEGKKNDIADSLSRLQMDRFCSLAPYAAPAPCPVPQALLVIWTQISRVS